MRKKTTLFFCALALLATACGRHRYDYVDVAASQLCAASLAEGFAAVPDSIPDGRRAFLLSQGIPVTDILFYPGERPDAARALPEVPSGFRAACIGTEALLDSLHAKGGCLYGEDGSNYRILMLLDGRMSLPVLSRISALAEDGAVIGGVRPSLLIGSSDTLFFQETVDRVWRSGNVIPGVTIRSALSAAGVLPDVKTRTPGLRFEHRHLPDAEIYRIVNPSDRAFRAKLKFRVTGRKPSVWDPATGQIRPVTYKIKAHKTKVILPLEAGADLFVVFGPRADRRREKVRS